jgi:hypothetical protein
MHLVRLEPGTSGVETGEHVARRVGIWLVGRTRSGGRMVGELGQ